MESMQQRLQQLKQMSRALKKQSEKPDDSTAVLIRSILKMTQTSKNNFNQTSETSTKSQGKFANLKRLESKINIEFLQAQSQEIIQLRQQNEQLQRKLILAKQQLNKKDKQNQKSKNQEMKVNENPYFRFQQSLNIFCTKLSISEEQFNKIQYQQKYLVLELDKLTILEIIQNRKVFNLLDLKEVIYHGQLIMKLHFQLQSGQIYNIFMQFANQEEACRWDLALFINWTIVNSLQRQFKLFRSEYFAISNNPQQVLISLNSQKDLLLQKKKNYSIHNFEGIKIQPTFKKIEPINLQDESQNILSPTKRAAKLSLQKKQKKKKFEESLQKLVQGYQINKYSQKGWFAHLKKIYIDEEKRLLCLEDVKNKSDVKKHPINMIQKIEYMQFGDGVKKHVSKPKPNNFVMIQLKNKILELGIDNPQLIYEFSNNLREVWSYYQQKNEVNLY